MPILTDARNALWSAIEDWLPLSGVFKRYYKFDGDDSPELNPTADQLPAIAIYPDPGVSVMKLNRAHQHNYKLLVLLFTATWNLETPDTYWEEIVKAAWQSGGGGPAPYVKLTTGFYPETEISVDQDRILLDGVKATLTTIGLTLTVRYDPQG